RRIVTYGFSALADVRADNVTPVPGGTRFDAVILGREGERRTIESVLVPIPGRHNVQNALAAIAVALELGISDEAIVAGEERVEGVDSNALVEGLRAHGHRMVRAVADLDELCGELRDLTAEGDMVICMGAGDITKWAAALPAGIVEARAKK